MNVRNRSDELSVPAVVGTYEKYPVVSTGPTGDRTDHSVVEESSSVTVSRVVSNQLSMFSET